MDPFAPARDSLNIPENSSIIQLPSKVNWGESSIQLIVTGGLNDENKAVRDAYGLSFRRVQVGGLPSLECILDIKYPDLP